jgi:hypothetical protein
MSKLRRGGFGMLVLAAIGCSDQSNAHQTTLVGPGAPSTHAGDVLLRKPDHSSNGLVSVDESALHADVHDRTLRLVIPVQADKGGAGSLTASLISVDGKNTVAVGEVSYAISEGQTAELTTELALPDDLQAQGDRVRYSVQVYDRANATLQVTRSLLYVVPPYELRLEGPSKLRTQKQASYRVRAIDPISHADAADAPITLQFTRDGTAPQILTGMTDSGGSAVFELAVDEPGDYTALATTQDQSAPLSVQAPVKVEAQAQKLLITTDKPIYQPGQTMHLRALALDSPDNHPQSGADVLFEVLDAKGNKVLKKTLKSDDYGIASSDFQLASLVNMGDFKVRASIGDTTSEKTVSVARYVLPKFSINISTDKPWYSAGSTITGSVDGRYFFGKNVSQADVDIQALTLDAGSNVFAHVMGKTDDAGHFTFSLALPSVLVGLPIQNNQALVTLRVQLTDAAGQIVSKDVALTVASDAVQISLVPEATALIPGISNRLLLFANDPLGAPIADAEVALDGDNSGPHHTDAYGTATLQLDGSYAGASVTVTLTPAGGMPIQRHFTFDAQSGGAHVLVRTDKAVYHLGDSVSVQLTASEQSGHAYVDWQNAGQSFDMRTLELDHGQASFQMTLDATLLGENRIDAYIVDADGNSIRSGRTILVNREGGLTVSLSQDKLQYKPGETAQLTLAVTNERGEPTAAALGVQIVDEAVFGLIDAQPGLLRTYFELEDDFAKPSYELQVPAVSFENLLFEKVDSTSQPERDAAQVMAEAQFSARGGMQMFGVAQSSWADALQQAKAQLETTRSAEQARLADAYKVIFKSAVDSLAAEGCNANSYYCNNNYQKTYTQVLAERALAVPTALNDYWGNPYTATWNDGYPRTLSVVSPGPDEKPYNDDDFTLMITAPELALPAPNFAGGFGAAGAAAFAPPPAGAPVATTPTAAAPTASAANGGAAPEPRVRTAFPETLYTNPALITDGTGKVTVPVELADSITSWRVSSLAHTRDGKLGGGQAGVTVFQDFFVDLDFPATLTRGDQVKFPVVVYNYLNSAQSVTIALDAGAWFTAQGSLKQTLQLSPNEVRSVLVPVTVTKVGQQTLTVRAAGTNVSDAVQRSVRVEADGTAVPAAQSGGLENGSVSLSQSFPSNAIDGSQQLYLDLYPAFQSQAVQGLDNMLQVPSGCFEQTTSTTWPDVLVSRYLDQNHQTSPELQLKADSLISAGYQRLLTFEHSSGGFSWFGEQDPQANVSVTAFGVMEFADMAKVHDVDPAMIERTQRWLAQQQGADGSWMGAQTESFSFQTSAARNTAFVVWALAQSGYSGVGLSAGLDYVASHLDSDADAYTLALAANAYAAVAPSDPQLDTILARLDKLKIEQDGMTSWDIGNSQTDFYSSGQDADVTTTALVVHAALSANRPAAAYKGAIDSITHAKDVNGNFGSTQASIWALKALLLAAAQSGDGAVGTLGVTVDGQLVQSVSLQKDAWDVTTRVDLSQFAKSGSHNVALDFAGSGQLSYNLVSNYNVPWTTPPATGPLAIAVSYDRASLAVNDSVTATVSVSNRTANTQNMLLVSVGIPPGFDLLTDDLDRQITAGALSRYEHTGKQLILYITSLTAQGTLALQYKLQASMPVTAADGGGQVYLYYQPDQRALASSTSLTVGG